MAGSGDEVKSTEYYRTQSTKVTAEVYNIIVFLMSIVEDFISYECVK